MSSTNSLDLIARLESLKPGLKSGDEDAQKEALMLSRMLGVSLNPPANTAVELAFGPFIAMGAKIAVDLHLFEYITAQETPISASELATLSGAEELLIIRVLRPLAATGFVTEVDSKSWIASPVSFAMASNEIASGHRMIWNLIVQAASKTPKYLKESGYKCPTEPHDGLVQYAFQTKLQCFDFISADPELLKDFTTFMGNTMGARNYWVDWYPVQKQILDGAESDGTLLVDVGGGKGHDLIQFHEKFPGNKLVLEEIPQVVENLRDSEQVFESVVYDFFTEQPLKNARVYFYHHILHDWADTKCLEILAGLKPAMKPGYSKLLLHEMIIPETKASGFHSMLDLTMMVFNAGMERTASQFTTLLEKAGFEVVKIWTPEGDHDADGIVEAMVRA
ncbi:hypothetical protein HYALB_00005119 [Hymenoscyphus albidus]|uniref:O-methyltransferase domain-containing protein n=1 Tax=Hymenoscyphus albidus TaxID=595503 RepID=A0A9N9LU90_9HELO|nr:hypothetical protein HYALB_00005119 [Hymenoscyphus albidus]